MRQDLKPRPAWLCLRFIDKGRSSPLTSLMNGPIVLNAAPRVLL